jgi:hypothetical protein
MLEPISAACASMACLLQLISQFYNISYFLRYVFMLWGWGIHD